MNFLFHAATSGELLHHLEWRHNTKFPTLKELVQELYAASAQWYTLGIFLRIPHPRLENIQRDRSTSMDCFVVMLSEWLNNSVQPTWNEVCEALDNIGEPALAAKIMEKYFHSH